MKKILTVIILSWPALSMAKPITYVSNKQVKNLQSQFKQATPIFNIENKPWKCTLYGMRSRTAKAKPVTLYNFIASTSSVANNGAHMTKSYQSSPQGLVAHLKQYQDTIRLTGSKQLIAELSVPTANIAMNDSVTSQVNKSRSVISYALCN